VLSRGIAKMSRALRGLPAPLTQRVFRSDTKPLCGSVGLIFPPFQDLALGTLHLLRTDIGGHDRHVLPQLRHHRCLPLGACGSFVRRREITHICHHDPRPPSQVVFAPTQAGQQQRRIRQIGGHDPTDQGQQRYRRMNRRQPQAQRVFFVADEPTALTTLKSAPSQGRALCGIGSSLFFLKPSQAAGKSVASISATA